MSPQQVDRYLFGDGADDDSLPTSSWANSSARSVSNCVRRLSLSITLLLNVGAEPPLANRARNA